MTKNFAFFHTNVDVYIYSEMNDLSLSSLSITEEIKRGLKLRAIGAKWDVRATVETRVDSICHGTSESLAYSSISKIFINGFPS